MANINLPVWTFWDTLFPIHFSLDIHDHIGSWALIVYSKGICLIQPKIIKQPWRSKEGQATKDGGLFSLECKEWKDDNLYPPRPTLNPFFPIHFSLNIHDHIGSWSLIVYSKGHVISKGLFGLLKFSLKKEQTNLSQ